MHHAAWALVVVALGWTAYFAREVLSPLFLAFLLSLVLQPAVERLCALRLPRWLAAALVAFGVVGAVGGAGAALSGPASRWVERAPSVLQELERRSRAFRGPARDVSELAERVERITEVEVRRSPSVRLEEGGFLDGALRAVWRTAAGFLVMLLTLYFALLTGHRALWRVIVRVGDMRGRNATEVATAVQSGMQRYLLTIGTINALLGLAIGLVLSLLDMPNPGLWGAMAAVANFVPYIGALAGTLVVGAVALVTFPGTSEALLPPLAYAGLTAVEGQLVTPLALGSRFRIDPLVVFAWLVVWTGLWGVAGAVVASPLLVLIKLTCEMSESLRPIAAFVTQRAGPRSEPFSERFSEPSSEPSSELGASSSPGASAGATTHLDDGHSHL